VHASERLSLTYLGKASRGKPRRKPELGNPTFRDCRGASGNVAMVELGTHFASESARLVTLHLQLSAPELYPDHVRICGRLGAKFPGPTRQSQPGAAYRGIAQEE